MLDILIIGGGLAGLTNAIHLSKAGLKVQLIEKNSFPKHKVCGEYISNEVLAYLKYLNVDPFQSGAVAINRFLLSTPKGKTVRANLPLGGFGISRYTLDQLLYQKAIESGCLVHQAIVDQIDFKEDAFTTKTRDGKVYISKFVIGAFGKRSNLDVALQRSFMQHKSPFLAVKAHYKGDFPDDLVALHNFRGGYCGISKVENNLLNICYLTDFKRFKASGNIEKFQQEVLFKNPHLKTIFQTVEPVFSEPLTISQISFRSKKAVENHIFMSGDTAGMIHPLCGNGMGMAIHSASILSDLVLQFFNSKNSTRADLEAAYCQKWQSTFRKRLLTGKLFNALFSRDKLFEAALSGLTLFPAILPRLIRQTHGEEFEMRN